MDKTKFIIMGEPWSQWVDECAEVSPKLEGVATNGSEELMREVVDADIVIGRLPREAFLKAERLKWVQSNGVGFETMLYPEMLSSEVIITNTAGALDSSVAEHAVALVLAYTRGLTTFERNRKDRIWNGEFPGIFQVSGKTACVAGLGSIGKGIASRLNSLGANIIAIDAQVHTPPEGVSRVFPPNQMLDALAQSDIVVIALPLTDGTRGLFDSKCFESMKETALLVNIARGPIVNESDLIEALGSGQIAAAGLDVFEEEPLPESSPLWDMPNVIFAPHVGGRSAESRDNIRGIFKENLRRYMNQEPLLNIIDKEKGYLVQN